MAKLFADEIDFGDPIGLGPTLSLYLVVVAEVFAPILYYGLQDSMGIPISYCGNVRCRVCYSRRRSFPKMEKALLYLFGYILIFITGPGHYSLDYFIDRERR